MEGILSVGIPILEVLLMYTIYDLHVVQRVPHKRCVEMVCRQNMSLAPGVMLKGIVPWTKSVLLNFQFRNFRLRLGNRASARHK